MKRILTILFVLVNSVIYSQATLTDLNLVFDISESNSYSSPFVVKGTVLHSTSEYNGNDINVGDLVYFQDGTTTYSLPIITIDSQSYSYVELQLIDISSTVSYVPTGRAALIRTSNPDLLPVPPDGIPSDLEAGILNDLRLKIQGGVTAAEEITDYAGGVIASPMVPPAVAPSSYTGKTWRNSMGVLYRSDGVAWTPIGGAAFDTLYTDATNQVLVLQGPNDSLSTPIIDIAPVQSITAGTGISVVPYPGGVFNIVNTGDLSNTNEIELPSQAGNNLKALYTNGTTPYWGTVASSIDTFGVYGSNLLVSLLNDGQPAKSVTASSILSAANGVSGTGSNNAAAFWNSTTSIDAATWMTRQTNQSQPNLRLEGSLNLKQPYDGNYAGQYGFRIERAGLGLDFSANATSTSDNFGFFPVGSQVGANNTFAFRNVYQWYPSANNQIHNFLFVTEPANFLSYTGCTHVMLNLRSRLYNSTSGAYYGASIDMAPVQALTGTSTVTALNLGVYHSQAGGGTGISRGLYMGAGQTGLVDFRAIDLDVNNGIGIRQSSTAVTNRFVGNTIFGSTNTPSAKLHVIGSGNSSTTWTAQFHNNATNNALMIRDDGNIGIGTASPTQKLQVAGNAVVDGVMAVGMPISTGHGLRTKAPAAGWALTMYDASNSFIGGFESNGRFTFSNSYHTIGASNSGAWVLGGREMIFTNDAAASNDVAYRFVAGATPTVLTRFGGNITLTNTTQSHTSWLVQTNLNQTGTSTGTITGIDYNPTITSITGSHYAALFRSGSVGIGTATPDSLLTIRSNSTDGTPYNGAIHLFDLNGNQLAGASTGITFSAPNNNFSSVPLKRAGIHMYTDNSGYSELRFNMLNGLNSGSYIDPLRLLRTGQIVLPQYTSGSAFTGTPVAYLATKSDGGVITQDPSTFASSVNYWTLGSGNVYRTTGNVGIGTTTPDSLLTIKTNTAGSSSGIHAGINLFDGNDGGLGGYSTGVVFSAPAASFSSTPLRRAGIHVSAGGDGYGYMTFNMLDGLNSGTYQEYGRLTRSGNWGFRTTNPAQTVHIQGTARITGSDGTATTIMGRDGDGDVSVLGLGSGLSITSGVLNVSASGATNLAVTGTASPLTLTSDTGTDVTFTAGTGVSLTGTSGNITINNTGDTNATDDLTTSTLFDGEIEGTYDNLFIKVNTVTSDHIVDGNVTMAKIANAGATSGQIISWNGTAWTPSNIGYSGTSDVAGTAASLTVSKIQGRGVATTAPTSGQVLAWSGSLWAPTTLSTGITSLNGQTGTTQTFFASSTGTDFSISSSGNVHTFVLPTANATQTGKLTSSDWTTFNSKASIGGTPAADQLAVFTNGTTISSSSALSYSASTLTVAGDISPTGKLKAGTLGTTPTVIVGRNASNEISTVTVGAGLSFNTGTGTLTASNMYTADGTLSGYRTIGFGNNSIQFNSTGASTNGVEQLIYFTKTTGSNFQYPISIYDETATQKFVLKVASTAVTLRTNTEDLKLGTSTKEWSMTNAGLLQFPGLSSNPTSTANSMWFNTTTNRLTVKTNDGNVKSIATLQDDLVGTNTQWSSSFNVGNTSYGNEVTNTLTSDITVTLGVDLTEGREYKLFNSNDGATWDTFWTVASGYTVKLKDVGNVTSSDGLLTMAPYRLFIITRYGNTIYVSY